MGHLLFLSRGHSVRRGGKKIAKTEAQKNSMKIK